MMNIVEGIAENEKLNVIGWSYDYFNHVIDINNFIMIIMSDTNWEKSLKLVDDEDNILGVYLLGDTQLKGYSLYSKLNGVHGVLLAVDSEIRGLGWGNKLKDYPKTMGYSYIWGEQLKSLNNIKDWLKRRDLLADTNYSYITAELFLDYYKK